jgi:hypothetical protein
MDRPPLPEFGFMRMWTRRVQGIVGAFIVAYVLQLVTQPVFETWLTLRPLGAGFAPWQPLTYTFVQSEPLWALMGWFVILNFLDSTIRALGTRRFWLSTLATWAGTTFLTLVAGLPGWFGAAPTTTPNWWIEAMIVWFAFSNRGATINLMMVLPMKAENLAWLSGLLNLLNVAYARDLQSVHMLLAWIVAYAVFFVPMLRRRDAAPLPRKGPRGPGFQVLEGGKLGDRPRRGKPDEYVN